MFQFIRTPAFIFLNFLLFLFLLWSGRCIMGCLVPQGLCTDTYTWSITFIFNKESCITYVNYKWWKIETQPVRLELILLEWFKTDNTLQLKLFHAQSYMWDPHLKTKLPCIKLCHIMRFYLLHDRQASWVKITLNSKLSAKQRGSIYISLQNVLSNASETVGKGGTYRERDEQQGRGWLLQTVAHFPVHVRSNLPPVVHPRLTQCCPISTHNSSQPELK